MIITFQPPPHVTVQLAGTTASGDGRRALARLIVTDHEGLRDDALLVASELVANAVQAANMCTLSAWFLAQVGAVRIEVTDSSPEHPVMRNPGDGRVGGFGLRIVDHLSTRWGVTTHADGKTTWCEIVAATD